MKASLACLSALCLLALSSPARAHHQNAATTPGYLAFWSGIQPRNPQALQAAIASGGVWRMAFVSKFRIVGGTLPDLAP
ncbi:MAG: hypothetical protein JWP91_1006 [Fibrobacteres bacterium]|nr:hypothetical protein [Fibrobacterota bacterium]